MPTTFDIDSDARVWCCQFRTRISESMKVEA